jgi:hypothetical protein
LFRFGFLATFILKSAFAQTKSQNVFYSEIFSASCQRPDARPQPVYNFCYNFLKYERKEKERARATDFRFDSQTDCAAESKIRARKAGRENSSFATQDKTQKKGRHRRLKMNFFKSFYNKIVRPSVWARPEMDVTFRAEIMPGKKRVERTFRIKEVLNSGRVTLHGFSGEHRQSSFEPVNFKREIKKAAD